MSKTIYDKVLEKLKENKEVELYRFVYMNSGDFKFYIEKVYTAEDGEKIVRSSVLASIFGYKYRLDEIKCVGTALINGESYIVKEVPTFENGLGYEYECILTYDEISQYSFSIKEAIMKERDENRLYFLGKDGYLYVVTHYEENKDSIELLLSKGLISKI